VVGVSGLTATENVMQPVEAWRRASCITFKCQLWQGTANVYDHFATTAKNYNDFHSGHFICTLAIIKI
jgi:hypothetical protein